MPVDAIDTNPVDTPMCCRSTGTTVDRMTAQNSPRPEALGLLTLSDWARLPEDELVHTELREGALLVMAKPAPNHQRMMMRLATQLDAQLPPSSRCFLKWSRARRTRPATVRVSDIVVVGAGVDTSKPIDVAEVVVGADPLPLQVHLTRP